MQIFLRALLKPGEKFDMTMCNPPFHSSSKEVNEKSSRKWKNLGQDKDTGLNFGGRNNELWYEGGEPRFLNKMMTESKQFAKIMQMVFIVRYHKKPRCPAVINRLIITKRRMLKPLPCRKGRKPAGFWRGDFR
jgi:23S rRNA (adenine1618-N6)-methyltransferase